MTKEAQLIEVLLAYLNDNLQPTYVVYLEQYDDLHPALCLRALKEIKKGRCNILGEYHMAMSFAVSVRMDAKKDAASRAYAILNHIAEIGKETLPTLGKEKRCESIEMTKNPVMESTNENQNMDFMAEYTMKYLSKSKLNN